MNIPVLSRENNFDVVRLFAAMQVMVCHGINHLHVTSLLGVVDVFSFFPGVIMFFVISGFLITSSLLRNLKYGGVIQYIRNRCLRIFPALWVSFILLLLLMAILGAIGVDHLFDVQFWMWIIGQITLFQYYTPDCLRDFGVGTPNGSLWTIPVEFEFYILLPFVFLCFKRISIQMKFMLLFVVSVLCNLTWALNNEDTMIDKLIGVSVVPYLYAFLLGGLLYLNWDRLRTFIAEKFVFWLAIYMAFCLLLDAYPGYSIGSLSTLVANLLLGLVTISAALSPVNVGKYLRGNDISYGMYIYHMLVINTFVELSLVGTIMDLLCVLIVTIIISVFSWRFIEKKALSMKYKH